MTDHRVHSTDAPIEHSKMQVDFTKDSREREVKQRVKPSAMIADLSVLQVPQQTYQVRVAFWLLHCNSVELDVQKPAQDRWMISFTLRGHLN